MKTHHHLRTALFSALFLLFLANTTFAAPLSASANQTDQTTLLYSSPGDDTPCFLNVSNATDVPGPLADSHDVINVDANNYQANSTNAKHNCGKNDDAGLYAKHDAIAYGNQTTSNTVAPYYDVSQIFYFTIANTNAGSGNQKQKSEGNTDGTPAVIFSSLMSSLHAANSTGSSFSALALIPFAIAAS